MTDEELLQYAKDKKAAWEERRRHFSALRDSEAEFLAIIVMKDERARCAKIVDKYAEANPVIAATLAQCADEIRKGRDVWGEAA